MSHALGDDEGYAVRYNGVLLLRTASDTPHQARCNGAVLLFDADPLTVNDTAPYVLEAVWNHFVKQSGGDMQIVACKAIERQDDERPADPL